MWCFRYDHLESPSKEPAAVDFAGHSRWADHRRGKMFDCVQKRVRVRPRLRLQAGQNQIVAADFFVHPQVMSAPPDQRVPPTTHAHQPLQPAHQVVAAAHVRQLVGQNPLRLVHVHLVKQRLRNHDADLSPNPPHQWRQLGGCGVDRRDGLQPESPRDPRSHGPQVRRRALRSRA